MKAKPSPPPSLPPEIERQVVTMQILRDQRREAAAKAELAETLAMQERIRLLQLQKAFPALTAEAAALVRAAT